MQESRSPSSHFFSSVRCSFAYHRAASAASLLTPEEPYSYARPNRLHPMNPPASQKERQAFRSSLEQAFSHSAPEQLLAGSSLGSCGAGAFSAATGAGAAGG